MYGVVPHREAAAAELCADSLPGLRGNQHALFTSNENYRRAMSSPSNAAEMHTAGASDRTPANYQQAFNLAIPKPSLEHSFRLCCDLEAVRSLGEGVHGDGGQQVPLPTSKNNPLLPSR